MRTRWGALLAAALIVAPAACGSDDEPSSDTGADAASEPSGDRLLARLRDGGVIVVFRHAATDRSVEDEEPVDLDDCSTQRNLTDGGRDDARTIGDAFRELGIPVGAVWASPYCRTRQTAELAFGRARVIDGLERLYPVPDEAAERRVNRLVGERAPGAGDPNLVISGHGVYPTVLEPAVALEEGEAALYERRAGEFALLDRIGPDEWAELGSASARGDASSRGLEGDDRVAVADEALASVVAVEVPGRGVTGSGFRVGIDRIVATGARVVGNADEVSVSLRDGSRRTARVLGRSPGFDIAALELDDDSGLPALHSGDGLAELDAGDQVHALGVPARINSGVVTALERRVRLADDAELDFLMTDASIDAGSSGGPVLDTAGNVVGVSTRRAPGGDAPADGGLAIPVDVARREVMAIVARTGAP